jgi:hypothetical protein
MLFDDGDWIYLLVDWQHHPSAVHWDHPCIMWYQPNDFFGKLDGMKRCDGVTDV